MSAAVVGTVAVVALIVLLVAVMTFLLVDPTDHKNQAPETAWVDIEDFGESFGDLRYRWTTSIEFITGQRDELLSQYDTEGRQVLAMGSAPDISLALGAALTAVSTEVPESIKITYAWEQS